MQALFASSGASAAGAVIGTNNSAGFMKRAIEILRRNSHDGRGLPIHAKNVSHRVGRGVEPIAPETIADHHNGRIAGLVESGAEQTSTLRFDTQHGKIIG